MPMRSDLDHYVARERQARQLAEAAIDPHVKAIHLRMAERYAELLEVANPNHMAEQPVWREQR